MKKHLVLAAAVFAGTMAMSAQMQVVKDAERAQKSGEPAAKVAEMIAPAFTNPETAQLAQVYYIPGKASFSEFDKLYGSKSLGLLKEGQDKQMADDLLRGYDFYMKALPLDETVDAKGKKKTKYTKEIINTIAGHANDFNDAALIYWEGKDYAGAYDSWNIFLGLQSDPLFEGKIKTIPDTIIGEIYFNQALAAWQADQLENALKSFANAESKGYSKKPLYDYALAVATGLKNEDAIFDWATKGNALYGKEDPNYLGNMINVYLQRKDYDKALSTIDEAIATDPNNAQYYLVKGILFDNMDKLDDAKAMFEKAVSLDANNVAALTQLGASICRQAYALSDTAPTSINESQAFFEAKIRPLFIEASQYLEKAWQLDNDNQDALRYLDNIYYNLNDDAKQQEIKARMLQ